MGILYVTGAGQGADPEEITARANDVVEGKTTIDAEGEVAKGDIRNMPAIYRADGERVASGGDGDNYIYTTIPNGAYLKTSWTGKPELGVPIESVRNAIGFRQDKILSDTTIAKVRGSVPISKTNNNHVKTSNEGFAYFNEGNHTWQYVMRVDRGHFIDDYDWVGFPEPDLRPENIKKGKRIGNVVGTMTDYDSGRVVFNGATFDGDLASGVAEPKRIIEVKGFDTINTPNCRYSFSDYSGNKSFGYNYGRDQRIEGIRDGGLSIYTEVTTNNRGSDTMNNYASYMLNKSIDLTPFKILRLRYKFSYLNENAYRCRYMISAAAINANIPKGSTSSFWEHNESASESNFSFDWLGYQKGSPKVPKKDEEKIIDVYTGHLKGQYLIVFGTIAEGAYDDGARVTFTNIELIN